MAGKTVDDLGERPVKKNLAMVDDENAMAKLFNILHVMTGQERHDAVFLVVDTQKFTDALLTNHVQTDGWFVEKEDARLMNQRGDQLHLHPLAQRQLAHHHIHFVLNLEKFGQSADNLRKTSAIDSVDRAVQLQRFLRGQVPPERIFLTHEQTELTFHFIAAFPRDKTENTRITGSRVEQAGEHLKNGGLARAVRTQEPDKFALVDLK